MQTKYAMQLLGCSSTTVKNYIHSGKLKIRKVLPNGRYDIDDESVYELAGKMAMTGKKKVNYLLTLDSAGNKHEFFVDELMLQQVIAYVEEKLRMQKEFGIDV